jgi:hypothetical protein
LTLRRLFSLLIPTSFSRILAEVRLMELAQISPNSKIGALKLFICLLGSASFRLHSDQMEDGAWKIRL